MFHVSFPVGQFSSILIVLHTVVYHVYQILSLCLGPSKCNACVGQTGINNMIVLLLAPIVNNLDLAKLSQDVKYIC